MFDRDHRMKDITEGLHVILLTLETGTPENYIYKTGGLENEKIGEGKDNSDGTEYNHVCSDKNYDFEDKIHIKKSLEKNLSSESSTYYDGQGNIIDIDSNNSEILSLLPSVTDEWLRRKSSRNVKKEHNISLKEHSMSLKAKNESSKEPKMSSYSPTVTSSSSSLSAVTSATSSSAVLSSCSEFKSNEKYLSSNKRMYERSNNNEQYESEDHRDKICNFECKNHDIPITENSTNIDCCSNCSFKRSCAFSSISKNNFCGINNANDIIIKNSNQRNNDEHFSSPIFPPEFVSIAHRMRDTVGNALFSYLYI